MRNGEYRQKEALNGTAARTKAPQKPCDYRADGSLCSSGPVSPIKQQTTTAGEPYTIVCVQQDDGRYVAEIVEAPEIRFVGRTRAQAERVVSKIYTDTRGQQEPHGEVEDRLWLELARANRETQGITPNEYRRQRGHS